MLSRSVLNTSDRSKRVSAVADRYMSTNPDRECGMNGNASKDVNVGDRQTYTITWLTSDDDDDNNNANDETNTIKFQAYHGETLRTAALRRGVASPHNGRANLINCRGLGTCGTCAVEVVQGQVKPSERTTKEQLRLNFPPHNFHNNAQRLRLACQIQITENLQVRKHTGFWGQQQGTTVPSQPQKYFGEWEYILDNKSPPERCDDDEK